MNLLARLILLAIDVLLLSAPAALQPWVGGDLRPYIIATVLVVVVSAALVRLWESATGQRHGAARAGWRHLAGSALVGILGGGVVVMSAQGWLHAILVQPNDPQRADMLVVVEQGIRRVLHGQNPYVLYHLPWTAPLPYGPALWLPFAVPFALHADIRFVTIAGMLFVPVACALAAFAEARRFEWPRAAGWLTVLGALAVSPDLSRFSAIGHTPAYWPLLALFVWLAAARRWRAAAVAAGLLIVARTTMVAVAPVFLMMVWHEARPQFERVLALLAAAAVVPFLPFAVRDFASLRYALYGSYQVVMKGFVWPQTTWAQHTIGITGALIAAGWPGAVEIVQAVAMLAVYAAAWRAIRRGRPALAWMGFALLAFSMTTLWPVTYIYFDVVLLFICAALVETPWLAASRAGVASAVTLALSVTVVTVTAVVVIPAAGVTRYRRLEREEILVPRLGRGDTHLEIDVTADAPQQMTALLNGTPLGTVTLTGGAQRISLAAPRRLWQTGVNELEPLFSGRVTGTTVERVTVK